MSKSCHPRRGDSRCATLPALRDGHRTHDAEQRITRARRTASRRFGVRRFASLLRYAVAVGFLSGVVVTALGAPPRGERADKSKTQKPPRTPTKRTPQRGTPAKRNTRPATPKRGAKGKQPARQPGSNPKTGGVPAKGTGDAKTEDAKKGAESNRIDVPTEVQQKLDALLQEQQQGGRRGVQPSISDKLPARSGTPATSGNPASGRPARGVNPPVDPKNPKPNIRLPGRTPAPSRTSPGARAGATGDAPSGPTEVINILPSDEDVPPEERMYEFGIKNATYTQLLEGVARQTGLGILGEAPKDGKVSFVTLEKLNFTEMLSRVRMLLFNYKPHDPYWLRREETHLKVVRVTDLYRELGPERMFRSLEQYRAANLPPEELALVIYQPKSGSVSRLKIIRDFMPDYVRIAPLEDRNAITIFALVRDIEKYFQLMEILVSDQDSDPRTLKVIPVEHITPTMAWTKIQKLMSLDEGGRGRSAASSGSRRVQREASPLDNMPEPAVSVVPDDAQGKLIVKAMQGKIHEIETLLPYVDVDTAASYLPVVIELEFAVAEDIVRLVQQIISASRGTGRSDKPAPRPKSGSKRNRGKSTATSTPVTADAVTLIAHPDGDAVIVIGPDEDVEHVRTLIAQFDTKAFVDPTFIPIEYADLDEVVAIVTQVMGAGSDGGKTGAGAPNLIADASSGGLWFRGTEKELTQIREIVSALDARDDPVTLHVVRLENQLPTFVAGILKQYEARDTGPAGPAPPRRSKKSGRSGTRRVGRSAAASTGKFTTDDEQMRLFILCTDEEWNLYEPLITQIEAEVNPEDPAFVVIPVEHLTPDEAAVKLRELLVAIDDPKAPGASAGRVRFGTTRDSVVVMGATADQIEKIREALVAFDEALERIERTFVIKYVDPQMIVDAIETLIAHEAGKSGVVKRTPGSKSPVSKTISVTSFIMDRNLVIQTSPKKMEAIAELIERFDVDEAAPVLRVYDDFPPGSDVQAIADTLAQLLSGKKVPKKGAGPGKRGVKQIDVADSAVQIIPQPQSRRLIVTAPEAEFERIERLIEVVRTSVVTEPIVVDFIPVKHADPDDIVEKIEPILTMKIAELESSGALSGQASSTNISAATKKSTSTRTVGKSGKWFHLEADKRNHRIAVAAPQVVIDEARRLVGLFDADGTEDVIATVELKSTPAAEMVATVNGIMSGVARKKARPGKPPTADLGGLSLNAAPGDRAVILRGPVDKVEEAKAWIEMIDALPSNNREIKVYVLDYAQVDQMVDLIMNTVAAVPSKLGNKPQRELRRKQEAEDDDPWVTKIQRTGPDMYLEADKIANTMIVAAPRVMLDRVDAIVAQFDTEEEQETIKTQVVPRITYELKHAPDALDAAFQLEMVLDQMWQPADQLPKVEAAMFGNALIIEYPDAKRFPEIEELIVKWVDKAPERNLEPVREVLPAEGISAEALAYLLQLKNPNIQFEIVDVSKRTIEDSPIEQVLPPKKSPTKKPSGVDPCVLPVSLERAAASLAAAVLSLAPASSSDAQSEENAQPKQEDKDDDALGEFSRRLLQDGTTGAAPAASTTATAPPVAADDDESAPVKKLKVYFDVERGTVFVEGDETLVDEVKNSYNEIKEELDKFPKPPDIRIYRVRYIDVNTATAIINEMFNATRQQLQQAQQQQRQALQQQRIAQRQQRQQAARQQQQAARDGDQPGRPGADRGNDKTAATPRGATPQLPPTSVRVYPNPRDRTLILRADPSQYPALLELLATIDQPEPIDSDFRTYMLKKLNAVEIEGRLKSMLGLNQPRRSSASRRSQPNTPGSPRGGRSAAVAPGSALPQSVVQVPVSGGSALAIDPEDINLSSNAESNTIYAMAPVAALDYIGELIEKFENVDLPERVWKTYELDYADAAGVVDYLSTYFSVGGAKAGRGGASGKSGGGSVSVLGINAPTFIAYVRLNHVSAQATEEQFPEIDGLVQQIDVPGEEMDWQTITLRDADAALVAETLVKMFGEAGTGGSRGQKGEGIVGAKFIGDAGGRMVFYTAPEALRKDILATVETIEAEAQTKVDPRVIRLVHAKPTDVADAIESAYGESARGGKGRGAAKARFSVTGHDPSKRLFVIADDKTFAEIESLAKSLDEPGKLGFDFRIYTMQFADARKIHDVMTKLITDYVKQIGRQNIDPFSVEVDEKANALIVLGGPAVFGFLEEKLPLLDVPANAREELGLLMITLKNADAAEVAQNINQLWSEKNLPPGQSPPQAESNRALNTLIVRGTQSQVDEIKKQFIDPLEENAPPQLTTETFDLQYAQPEAVAESINQIFEDKKRAMVQLRGKSAPAIEYTVIATPDVNAKQIIVQSNATNMELVRARVAELDKPENAVETAVSLEIYPVKYADPTAVAQIINEWARSMTSGGGRQRTVSAKDVVRAQAENATQTVVVSASQAKHLIVKELIDGLDDETMAGLQRTQHVVALEHGNADDIASSLTNVFKQAQKRRGDVGPGFVSEPATNTVVVTANDVEFAKVTKLLASLDVEPVTEKQVHVKSYKLTFAEPGSVENAINQLFRGSRNPRDQVIAVPEWGSRSVIVSASPQNHKRISQLVSEFESEGVAQKDVYVINLKNVDADSITRTLTEIFIRSAPRQQGNQAPPISISPLMGSKSIIVKCGPDDFADIQKVVDELDTEAAVAGEVRVVTLDYADATEVHRALQETLRKPQGRGQELIGDVRISLLATSNALVISASSKEEADGIEARIAAMDAAGEGGAVSHIIALEFTKVGQILPAVQEQFTQQRRGGRNQQPPVITGSEALNALIVRASPTDFSAIESLVKQLDTEEAADKPNFKIIRIKPGLNITDLAFKVQRAVNDGAMANAPSGGRGLGGRRQVPQVTVEPDTRSNSLIVSGSPSLFDSVETLAKSLEEMGPSGGRGTRIVTLKNRSVDEIQRLIDQLTQRGASGNQSRFNRGTGQRSGGNRANRGRTGNNRTNRGRNTGNRTNRGRNTGNRTNRGRSNTGRQNRTGSQRRPGGR